MYCDPRGGHNKKSINKDFFKIWSPSMAYVLGLIFADGAIEDVRKSSRTCYTAISSNDHSLLMDVKRVMSSNHKLYIKKQQWTTFPDGKKFLCKEHYILRIGGKKIFEDLVSLGVTPRKSLTLTFPLVPKKYLSHFIRGYFDGDGCIHTKLQIGRKTPILTTIFTSGSCRFLTSLSVKLHRVLDIKPPKIKFQYRAYRLIYKKCSSLKLLNFIYSDIAKSIYLDRKYTKYISYLMTIHRFAQISV